MKRFWILSLGLVMASSSTTPTMAVQDWSQPSAYESSSVVQPNYFNSQQAPDMNTRQAPGAFVPDGIVPEQSFQGNAPNATVPGTTAPSQGYYGSAQTYSDPTQNYSPNYAGPVDNSGCGAGGNNGEVANCNANGGQGHRFGRSMVQATGSRNMVAGLGAVVFRRDYEDDLGLSANANGDYLFSTSAQNNYMGGLEAFIQSRNCNGRGWEARYWGLYPSSSTATIDNMPYTALGQLSQITHGPTMLMADTIFNQADTHTVTRSNQFHNAEFNRLINAGTVNGWMGSPANFELLHGVRWFEFDEDMSYSAQSAVYNPMRLDYNVNAQNTLLGYQVGGRSVRCVSNRLQLISGVKFGLYNNRIRHRQSIIDENDYISYINAGPSASRPLDYWSSKNDVSTLSELDLGIGYLVSCNIRLTAGYRVMGITGLALAPNQVPASFVDSMEIQRIQSNGSMILHGMYGGVNFCF